MEVVRPKSDCGTHDSINGFTRTVRLSLKFPGLTVQTINESVRMQKDINYIYPYVSKLGLVARVTSD